MSDKLKRILFQKDISGYLIALVIMFGIAGFIYSEMKGSYASSNSQNHQQNIISGCEIAQKKLGGLSDYFLKKCIKRHKKLYKNGEPSFATHSWEEAWLYRNEEDRKRSHESRSSSAGKKLLATINEGCQEILGALLVVDSSRRTHGLDQAKAIQYANEMKNKEKALTKLFALRYLKQGIKELYMGDGDPVPIGMKWVGECKISEERSFGLRE